MNDFEVKIATLELQHSTKDSLNRIEHTLNETTEVAESTAAELRAQGERLGHIKANANDVKSGLKRTHKLLDTFAKWASCGCLCGMGSRKSRKAGRRGQRDLAAKARIDKQRAKTIKKHSKKTVAQKQQEADSQACFSSPISTITHDEKGIAPSSTQPELNPANLLRAKEHTKQDANDEEQQLERIHQLVLGLAQRSQGMHDEVEAQSAEISEVQEANSDGLKSARKAQARVAWHLKKRK